MNFKITALLLSVTFFLHCSPKKIHNKQSYEKVTFGSGGGFTGMVKSYSIDPQGNLFSENDKKKIKTISKKQLKDLTKKAGMADIFNTSFDKPGNFYYFIEVQKNGKTNKVTWNDQEKASENVIILYQYLTNLINQQQ